MNRDPVRTRPAATVRFVFALACSVIIVGSPGAHGQSLEERLDEEKFLRGLSEYQLPEVLEHYSSTRSTEDRESGLLYQVAAAQMAANREGLTPAERLAALEDVAARRRALIEAFPSDPNQAVWLADQATDLLFGVLPIDAAGLTALFGVPTPAQLERATRVAREVNRLAEHAEFYVGEAILTLESKPDYQDDIALQLTRRRLARDQRDRRIPFLRGVGAVLHAELNVENETEREQLYQLALDVLPPLENELEGFLQDRVRLYAGLAYARLGDYTQARQAFSEVRSNQNADRLDRFFGRMGTVIVEQESEGEQAALAELDSFAADYSATRDVFFRLLIADQRFRLMREIAMKATGDERRARMQEAFGVYMELLQIDIGIDRETMQSIVFEKLATAADERTPVENLPSIVMVARAVNLSRSDQTRERAIALFNRALADPDLRDDSRATALFGLARAHYDSRAWLDAATRFEQLAREYPDDAEAERAIQAAVALLADLYGKTQSRQVGDRFGAVLDLLLRQYPHLERVERWRYELGRLHLDRDQYTEAQSRFAEIPPDAEPYLDAQFMLAGIARARAYHESVDGSPHPDQIEPLIQTLHDVRATLKAARADIADEMRREEIDYYLDSLAIFEGEALLAQDDARAAVELLDPIDASRVDRAILGDLLRIRIQAHQKAGNSAAARQEIQQFVQTIPDEAGEVLPGILAPLREETERLLNSTRPERGTIQAKNDLVPLAEALESWRGLRALPREQQAALILQIADAYRLAEQWERALPLYEGLLLDRPDALQPLFGRAEALFGTAQYVEAVSIYKRISRIRESEHDDYFWQSELRLLQVLDQVKRGVAQIPPRIRQLEAIDQSFHKPRFARGFEALRVKYAGQR